MSSDAHVWVVDRVERDIVVLVHDETAGTVEIPRRSLPAGAREGDVLRVAPGADGEPDWANAFVDIDLRRERLEEARAALDRLRSRDPGGDLKL